jgi:hypothetical protein
MYENIIAILDKSKNDNVDLLTAQDMLVAERKEDYKALKEAGTFIRTYYDTIAKCRRLGDNETIKKLVEVSHPERIAIMEEVKRREE